MLLIILETVLCTHHCLLILYFEPLSNDLSPPPTSFDDEDMDQDQDLAPLALKRGYKSYKYRQPYMIARPSHDIYNVSLCSPFSRILILHRDLHSCLINFIQTPGKRPSRQPFYQVMRTFFIDLLS